jgi:hypothetical protein
MTTTTKTLYIGFNEGNVTCYDHAGVTLKESIKDRGPLSEWFKGIESVYFVAKEFDYKQFAENDMQLVCESCNK